MEDSRCVRSRCCDRPYTAVVRVGAATPGATTLSRIQVSPVSGLFLVLDDFLLRKFLNLKFFFFRACLFCKGKGDEHGEGMEVPCVAAAAAATATGEFTLAVANGILHDENMFSS